MLGTALTPSYTSPSLAPPCILLLLERIDLKDETCVDVTGQGLGYLKSQRGCELERQDDVCNFKSRYHGTTISSCQFCAMISSY